MLTIIQRLLSLWTWRHFIAAWHRSHSSAPLHRRYGKEKPELLPDAGPHSTRTLYRGHPSVVLEADRLS